MGDYIGDYEVGRTQNARMLEYCSFEIKFQVYGSRFRVCVDGFRV